MKIQMTHKKTGKSVVVGPFRKGVSWAEDWDRRRIEELAWENATEDRLVDDSQRPSDYTYSIIEGEPPS